MKTVCGVLVALRNSRTKTQTLAYGRSRLPDEAPYLKMEGAPI
jgi:hypothetical protein